MRNSGKLDYLCATDISIPVLLCIQGRNLLFSSNSTLKQFTSQSLPFIADNAFCLNFLLNDKAERERGARNIFPICLHDHQKLRNYEHVAQRSHFAPGFGPPKSGRRVFYLESKVKLCNIFLNFRIPRMGYFSFIIGRDLFLPCSLPQTTWPMLRSTTPRSLLLPSTPYYLIPSRKVFNMVQYHGYDFHYFYTIPLQKKMYQQRENATRI